MANWKRTGPLSLPWARAMDNWETFPLMALQAIAQARSLMDKVERDAVLRAREMGATWKDLGSALGVTRQTMIKRYGRESTERLKRDHSGNNAASVQ